jgi:HAD superfamily hydrolase (TIGR01509 family)
MIATPMERRTHSIRPLVSRRPRALLFDMDGTLTRPMLDFPRIKAEMGIGVRPILEALAEMAPEARRVAEAVLLRHEEEAARESTLNEGCDAVLGWARSRGIGTALITRNSRTSVETVLGRHGLVVDFVVSRDDAAPKPDPHPLRLACERLGVSADEAWMVGDGQYDVEAGLAAGVATVWVSHGRVREFAAAPWKTVVDLCGLRTMLEQAGE